MAKDLELKLRITADGKVAVQQLGAVDKAVDGVGDSAEQAAQPMAGLASGLGSVGKALAGLGLGLGAREIIAMAEGFGQLQARLKLAADGFGSAEQAMADVQRIADSTGASLTSVGDLYSKTAGAAKSLGLSQEQVAAVTETVAKGMRVAGATTAGAEGAITQFSQALASGVLRGEEYNSVVEAAPYLIDQMAKGLGVAREDMKALADAGQLSARSVADALVKQAADIDAAYGTLPDTVGQAMQRVANAFTAYVGGANEATKLTETLAGAMNLAAENVDLLGPAAAAAAAGGIAALTQAGVAQVASIKAQIAGYLAQRAALAEQGAASAAAARSAAALAVADLQAARAAQATAIARQAAAAQQLKDMAALTIYGAARAAGERELAAANLQLAASEKALALASAQSATATTAATAAMAGGAASVGILSRAMSFLAGPGGILLATVAGFAAFAFSQRDATPPTEELTDAINRQREAMDRLGTEGLKKLIRDEAEYQSETQKRLAGLKDQATALDEQARVLRRMSAAQQERTGAEQRLQDLERQGLNLRAEIEALESDLARSIDSVTQAQGRQNVSVTQREESVAALAKRLTEQAKAEEAVAKSVAGALAAQIASATASAARAKALGDEGAALTAQAQASALALTAKQAELALTEQAIARAQEEIAARAASGIAKRSELEALAQTLTALQGEAEARRGAIAASQAEITQAQLAAATYGDQSDQLTGLIQIRDRLTAAIRAEGEASAAAVPLQQALAVITVQIADAANDAAANIERQTQANQRALTIDQARLALQSDETARLAALATARGNATQAAIYHRDIMRDEAAALDLASQAKARDAALLLERARLMEIAARATGGFTAEERAAIDAMRDAATMAEIEAERMAIGAETKRDAARAGAELAEQNRRLADAFDAAGVAGVRAMDDVRSAVSRAATGPELQALADGLEAAIQAGIDKAGELSEALAEVEAKMEKLAKTERKATTNFEQIFSQYGTDIGRYEKGAFKGLQGPGSREIVEKEIAAYVEWLKSNKGYGAKPATQPPQTSSPGLQPLASSTVNINVAGILDINDRGSLDALARKLSPVLADLARRGVV